MRAYVNSFILETVASVASLLLSVQCCQERRTAMGGNTSGDPGPWSMPGIS